MAAATIGDALQGFLGMQAARPKAVITNSPAGPTAAMRERQHQLERRLVKMEREAVKHRQQAEEYGHNLKLASDQLTELRLASEARTNVLEERERALTLAQNLNVAMKRAVAGLRKEIAESTAWANEPARGAEALAHLLAGGDAMGRPTYVGTQIQWSPGLLREIHMWRMAGACACMREFAANSLSNPQRRFGDAAILGQGGFGIIRRGRCKKTNRVCAIKLIKPGYSGEALVREMLAFSIVGAHKNIVSIYALSDVAGSEGVIMEVAVCDLLAATMGTSNPAFTLDQILSLEADSTEGLAYMHDRGIIHCDVKLANTLICRADGPGGFVGKLTDPGVWLGLGEQRPVRTGTLGRVPVENMLGEVLAVPNQDAFAAGSDSCFLVMQPGMKTGGVNLWAHWNLTTEEEKELILARNAEGGDVRSIREDVTLRTMTDGTLARVLLQPEMLNPAIPASELANTCEVLRRMVSRDPTERLAMPAFTAFLRHLAAKTAAALVAPLPEIHPPPVMEPPSGVVPGIGQPPGIGLPPPEVAVIADGADGGEGLIPQAGGIRGGDDIPAPALVVAPQAEGNSVGAAAAVPLAQALEVSDGLVSSDSARPAIGSPAEAEPVAVANSIVPPLGEIAPGTISVQRVPLASLPVVESHAERNPDAAADHVLPNEPFEAGNDSAPPAVDPPAVGEAASPVVPSLEDTQAGAPSTERVNPAPSSVVMPHAEGDHNGLAAVVPPTETMHGPAPPVADSLADAKSADGADISLEGIDRSVNPVFRPFPASPAEVMANFVADTLRTRRDPLEMENVPLRVAARPIARQFYRGDGGRGSGSDGGGGGGGHGGGGGGGGEGFGGRSTQKEGGKWRGWLAGLIRR